MMDVRVAAWTALKGMKSIVQQRPSIKASQGLAAAKEIENADESVMRPSESFRTVALCQLQHRRQWILLECECICHTSSDVF